MDESDVFLVTTTVSCETEAESLAEQLIQEKLAACVQITGPIISHYRWKGRNHRELEWRCESKTLKPRLPALIDFLRDNHPYETPELVVVRVFAASETYHDWMKTVLES